MNEQLVFPELLRVATPESIFRERLYVEFKAGGSEVERMIAGQKWLAKQ